MKLKNKKTGVIVFVEDTSSLEYHSIAELNEEWEDYEEPKEHWEILAMGGVIKIPDAGAYELQQEIGNYFETKEEAEKAVEKLKAWKRLRDKGFRFKKWVEFGHSQGVLWNAENAVMFDGDYNENDLDLLFGDEE